MRHSIEIRSKALIAKLNIAKDLQAALAQFAAVTRVKERPGFQIAPTNFGRRGDRGYNALTHAS